MTTKSTTQVDEYFRKARNFYPTLGIKNSTLHRKKQECDAAFLQKFGLPLTIKRSWYRNGIKPIYWKILDLLEENERLEKSRKI